MTNIIFEELNIESSRVDVRARTGETTHDLWFELSRDVPITSSSVAVALSTLCGRAFKEIRFDFAVANCVIEPITELTHADIFATGVEHVDEGPRSGTLLSFSGGFDSLAARALMPADTGLVSMDFGGRFSRERQFFERFETLRVSTNVVDTPLRLNSWSFMGIGAILASDYCRAKYHTFGGILEAGIDNMRRSPSSAKSNTFPPFRAARYINAPYVLGLTEIGTLIVLLRSNPEMVPPSLFSLASPGEEKLYRKAVLTQLVADHLQISVEFDPVEPPPQPHFRFGQNFSLDLLALYAVSKKKDPSAMGLVRDIPASAAEAARNLDMAFMERANPTLYEHFPEPLMGDLYRRLGECGIRWYTEADWESFQSVRKLIGAHHQL